MSLYTIKKRKEIYRISSENWGNFPISPKKEKFFLFPFFLAILPGVNFINVKRTNILYECHFGSFFTYICMYINRKKAAVMTFVRNILEYNVDEIDHSQLNPFLLTLIRKFKVTYILLRKRCCYGLFFQIMINNLVIS